MVLIHPCRALSSVLVGTEQDEDKSNFLFCRSWDVWINFKFLCTVFSRFIHAHDIAILNHDEIIYVSLDYRAYYE